MTTTAHDLGEESAWAALRLLGSESVRGQEKKQLRVFPHGGEIYFGWGGGGQILHLSNAAPSAFWARPTAAAESRAEQRRVD